jgi:hypothetical protein
MNLSEIPQSLKQQPCKCVLCDCCRGQGTMRVDDWSQASGYYLETCYECHGSGITEECDRCMQIGELCHDQF